MHIRGITVSATLTATFICPKASAVIRTVSAGTHQRPITVRLVSACMLFLLFHFISRTLPL